jgi:hypothetical protein
MKVKRYAVELHDRRSQADWRRRQAPIDAVFDKAKMPSHVQLNATEKAIEETRKELGGDFHVEEIAGREPRG